MLKNKSQVYIGPTLGQRSIFHHFYQKPKWQAYVGPMLAQRNAPNATQSCLNKPPVYIGPTLGQRIDYN